MSTSHNKMGDALRKGLAEFGLVRAAASKSKSKYFGIKSDGSMVFPKSAENIDQKTGTEIAQYVPEGMETIDLLEPEFGKKLSTKDPKSVKVYLRRLLESI